MNNRAHSSALELLQSTDCLVKQLPDPSISRRLTFGRHHPGIKLAEKETGSIPRCSAATIGTPKTTRAWSVPQQSYSEGARLVEGKPSNRNTSSSTIWLFTQRSNRKVSNYTEDRWINPQTWEETSAKRMKTPKTRTPILLQGITNSSSAREHGWMENECDELTETGFVEPFLKFLNFFALG